MRQTLLALALVALGGPVWGASLTLSPNPCYLRVGNTQQLGLTPSGLTDSSVTWSVNGIPGGNSTVGTVNSTGWYSAPQTPALGSVTVTATSVMMPSVTGSATVVLWNRTPQINFVDPYGINTGNFTELVNGANFVAGATATINGHAIDVQYISPTQLKVTGSTTAAAGSVATFVVTNPDPGSSSATKNYTLLPPVTVSISPNTDQNVLVGTSKTFNRTITNISQTDVTWAVNGITGGNATVGTIVPNTSYSAIYTAPSSVPSSATVQITASSSWYPTKTSPSTSVNIYGPSLTVTPSNTGVRAAGGSFDFGVQTVGLSSNTVTWSVNNIAGGNSTVGTIDNTGLYKAPPTSSLGTVTIKAVSTVNSAVSGTATASLLNPTPYINYIDPTGINTGAFSEIVNGGNFVPGATATLNGAPLSVTYLSATQLRVAGSTSSAAGSSVPLVITNPNPGSASVTKSYTLLPPVQLTINPSTSQTLLVAKTLYVSRSITNISETDVTWSVNGITGGNATVGTITPNNSYSATYTAPAAVPNPSTVNITSTSQWYTNIVSDPTPVSIYGPSLTVNPSTASVRAAGGKFDFGVQTIGLTDNTMNWSVNGIAGGNSTVGTIDSNGLYFAPPTSSLGSVTITATSAQVSSVSGTATATLWNPTPNITGTDPTRPNSGAFRINVLGTNFVNGATASLNGAGMSCSFVSTTQLNCTGTTDAVAGSQATLMVTNPDPGSASDTSTKTVSATVTVSLTTSTTSLRPSEQATFKGSVSNTSESGIDYFVNGIANGNSSVGTIVDNGDGTATYTAPASAPSAASVSITAGSDWYPSIVSTPVVIALQNPQPVLTSVSPNPIPYGNFAVTVTGTGFLNSSVINYGGTPLTTTFVSSTQLKASGTAAPIVGAYGAITVSNPDPGAVVSNTVGVPLYEKNAVITYQAAVRFLEQATWGPTPADINHLQKIGFQAWLNEQRGITPTTYPAATNLQNFQTDFFQMALTGQDQLRQRTAWALSQIVVVGSRNILTAGMIGYEQTLNSLAFGNYSDLLSQATLLPAMGTYLSMANSVKAAANGGVLPNENYARELMQLFSIGTVMLNPDGSAQLDGSNNTIPTYTQTTIQNTARALTGWTYPTQPGASPRNQNPPYYVGPMIPVEANHDTDQKTVVGGLVLPAGQTTRQDLNMILQALFNHANTAPYVSYRMILHMVTSNPSPAYVARVAAVFNNDGSGQRGNLFAVVSAILLDPEARQNDNAATPLMTAGHMREPALFVTSAFRSLNVNVTDSWRAVTQSNSMGESVYAPPSVFSYFPVDYSLPGGSGFIGPEFSAFTYPAVINRVNFMDQLLRGTLPDTSVDLSSLMNLSGDPNSLVTAAGNALLGGWMPDDVRGAILPAVNSTTSPLKQAQFALYLTGASSYYQVER